MITIRNLTKKFKPENKEVLSRISLRIDQGDFVAIIGASGSGKSTLLRALSLRERWDEGQFIYSGKDITSMDLLSKYKLRKEWAYLEEKAALNGQTTALKNVLKGYLFQKNILRMGMGSGLVSRDEHVLGMDYLEKVGLIDKAHEKVSNLSGGEQQRVALARALVQGAKVIYADEPVTGLDPESVNRVLQDFRQLCNKEKVTIVCSVHQVELAERFATRIWGLAEGKIVLDIPARRLTQREKDLIL